MFTDFKQITAHNVRFYFIRDFVIIFLRLRCASKIHKENPDPNPSSKVRIPLICQRVKVPVTEPDIIFNDKPLLFVLRQFIFARLPIHPVFP